MSFNLWKFSLWWILLNLFLQIPLMRTFLNLRELANSGVLATGTVASKSFHGQVRYSFKVHDVTYSGSAVADKGGLPKYEFLNPGDRIEIYYLERNPAVNTAGVAREVFDDEFNFRLALVGLASLATVLLYVQAALFPRRVVFGLPVWKINKLLF